MNRAVLELDRRIEKVAAWVAAAACVLFALAAAWELFGPIPGGHLGNAAGAAIAGENMWHWKIFGWVLDYMPQRPTPADYYARHPYGVIIDYALTYAVFGHHWFTLRLPGVILSTLTPPLVYRTARALWGVVPGAIATVTFVFVPIDLAYANFHNLEVVTIFWGLLFTWGTIRLFQTWNQAYLIAATVGAFGTCQGDWVGLVLVGTVGILAFIRAYAMPQRVFGPVNEREHARWFAYVTAAAVLTLVMYVALIGKANKFPELMSKYDARRDGSETPLSVIFDQRRVMRLTWMLPKITLAAIALAAPLNWVRAFGRRNFEELVPLAWFAAASFQYFFFPEGADIHVFWPHYYGVCAALGFGVIAATVIPVTTWLIDRGFRAPSRIPAIVSIAPFAIALALLGRVAFPLLRQSRMTGGRFDNGDIYIGIDQDKNQFAQWAFADEPAKATAIFHSSFENAWFTAFAAHHPVRPMSVQAAPIAATDPNRYEVLDTRTASVRDLQQIAKTMSPEVVGPFWRIDRTLGGGGMRALRYTEEQPRGLRWYFITGTDLIRKIGPDEDPIRTWEWRDAFGLPTSRPPMPANGTPSDAEDARILYNEATSRGDHATADRMRAIAEQSLTTRLDGRYSNGVRLLGARVDEGAVTVVTLLFETGPEYVPVESEYVVHSFVEAPPPLWISAIDKFEKDVAPSMSLHMPLWKPGRLYSHKFVVLRRIGTERFDAYFLDRGPTTPKLLDGRERFPLFTLH